MIVNNDKLILNQQRRKAKRDRECVRKLNGTYVHKKPGIIINKWGKPYYEKERIETPWRKNRSQNSKYVYWLNPVTHQVLEDYMVTQEPEPHISYRYISTGPLANIKK